MVLIVFLADSEGGGRWWWSIYRSLVQHVRSGFEPEGRMASRATTEVNKCKQRISGEGCVSQCKPRARECGRCKCTSTSRLTLSVVPTFPFLTLVPITKPPTPHKSVRKQCGNKQNSTFTIAPSKDWQPRRPSPRGDAAQAKESGTVAIPNSSRVRAFCK